jgi:hypothetical protein
MAKTKIKKLPPSNIYFWNPAGFVFRVMNPELVPHTGVGDGKSKRERLDRHLDAARRKQVYCFNRESVPTALKNKLAAMAPGPDKRKEIKRTIEMYSGLFPCRELDPADNKDRKLIEKYNADFVAAQTKTREADERFRVKTAGSEESAKEMLLAMLLEQQKAKAAPKKPKAKRSKVA